MDSITQAALGAAIGESLLGKKVGGKAALAGAIIATIPDMDMFLRLFYSKFDMLSIHRGFSHSIIFSIIVAFIIAFFLQRNKAFRQISYHFLWLFSWLALVTHSLLDAFTAYGTQLFLPFSSQRVGFDSINVVDPLYTIPLLLGLFLSLYLYKSTPNRSKYSHIALIISSIYLLFTLFHKKRVENKINTQLLQKNIKYLDLLTMPVGIANINWYGVAKTTDSIYMLKYAPFQTMEEKIVSFPINEKYLSAINPEVAAKMRWFAKGFYTVEKVHDTIRFYNLQVDMRGIIETKHFKAPTAGYFNLLNKGNQTHFSSGTISNR